MRRPARALPTLGLLLLASCSDFQLAPLASDPPGAPSGSLAVQATSATSRPGFTSTGLVRATLAVQVSVGSSFQYELSGGASFAGLWSEPLPAAEPAALLFQLGPGDGTKTLTARIRDERGTQTVLPAASIVLDTTPPLGSVSLWLDGSPAPEILRTREVTLAYVAGPDVVEVAVSNGDLDCAGAAYHPLPAGLDPSEPWTLPDGPGQATTVRACFRDAAGNTSSAACTAVWDPTAPAAPTVRIVGEGTDPVEFVPRAQVTLEFAADPDVASLLVVNTTPGACPDGGEWRPFQPLVPWDLDGAAPRPDGPRTVVVRARDAAGNLSPTCSEATVQVDTTPPPAPLIVTRDQVLAAVPDDSFTVVLSGPDPSETHFARWERRGGLDDAWTPAGTDPLLLEFPFLLRRDASARAGVRNELRLRAVDRAGNAGPESLVVVVYDVTPPAAVTLDPRWVANQDGQAALSWRPPDPDADPDVVSFQVSYGPASGVYTGRNAAQGLSPFRVPATARSLESVTLTGLTNQATTWVTVHAVDWAGNVSAAPSSPAEVMLQPNVVSPDLVAEAPLAFTHPRRLLVQDGRLYAFGTQATGPDRLQVFELGRLGSTRQVGPPPLELARLEFAASSCPAPADPIGCGGDLALDGAWAFVGSGGTVHVLFLLGPAPVEVAQLDLGLGTVHELLVRGDTLFGTATRESPAGASLFALDLGKLRDGDPATFPSPSDLLGTTDADLRSCGLAWTRERLLQAGGDGQSLVFDLSALYDDDPATTWPPPSTRVVGFGGRAPVVSGNLVYATRPTFGAWDLGAAWASTGGTWTPARSLGVTAEGPFTVSGPQAFLNAAAEPGLRALDLGDPAAIAESATYRSVAGAYVGANTTWGNYLFAAMEGGSLQVLALASPEAPRAVATSPAPPARFTHTSNAGLLGVRNAVAGGFLLHASGLVFDLQAGATPPLAGPYGAVAFQAALFEETLVQAAGCRLRVVELAEALDRDPATTLDPLAPGGAFYDLELPGAWATGLARHGSALVVVERREDGTWLEVLDATPLLDRSRASRLSRTVRGEVRVTTAKGLAHVSLDAGRALVALSPGPGGDAASSGLWVVDLRAALDDSAATTLGAGSVQAHLPLQLALPAPENRTVVVAPREGSLRGGWAVATSADGLVVADVSKALDDDPTTQVGPGDAIHLVTRVRDGWGLAVHGSWAVVAANSALGAGTLYSVDLSPLFLAAPEAPLLVGQASFQGTGPAGSLYQMPAWSSGICAELSGGPGYDLARPTLGPGVSVAGSRAYVTSNDGLTVFELE